MAVIDQAFEEYIDGQIHTFCRNHWKSALTFLSPRQNVFVIGKLVVGQVQKISFAGAVRVVSPDGGVYPRVKADQHMIHGGPAYYESTAQTLEAFRRLESTDWVAYDLDYHVGFPLGVSAVDYLEQKLSGKLPSDSNALLDLPDGADKKLNEILNGKDPFRFTPREWLCKIKSKL